MSLVWQPLFAVLMPAVVLWAVKRIRALSFIGPTLLCYLIGIAAANLPLPIDKSISMRVSEVSILLAIPLLLFTTDFVRWLRLAKTTVLSFILAVASVMVVSAVGAFIFGGRLPDAWKLSGMFVGVYTGGTANMSAIGLALRVSEETFILVNAADVVVSGLYLIFLLTVAQRVLLRFMPAFQPAGGPGPDAAADARGTPDPPGAPPAPAARPTLAARVLQTAGAAGAAVVVVALSVGLSLLITGKMAEALILLSITTLGIAASFLPRLRHLTGAYDFGHYLLLVFCVAIGTIADFRELAGTPLIFAYCAFAVLGSVALHYFLASRFRIDADTAIITSTAAVFSPAFVGPVAAALKNREIIVSGITTGLVGYAVGNYLGLALAYLLKP